MQTITINTSGELFVPKSATARPAPLPFIIPNEDSYTNRPAPGANALAALGVLTVAFIGIVTTFIHYL